MPEPQVEAACRLAAPTGIKLKRCLGGTPEKGRKDKDKTKNFRRKIPEIFSSLLMHFLIF
jgi:hypothetical protein